MAKNQLVITIKSKDLYEKIKKLPRGIKGLIIEIALMEFLDNPRNQRIISLATEKKEVAISDILKEFLTNREEDINKKENIENKETKEKRKEKKKKEKEKEKEEHIENKTKEETEETIEDKDEDEIDGIDPGAFFDF